MTEALLAAIFVVLCVIAALLSKLLGAVTQWSGQWGSRPMQASDFNLRELRKTADEIAHMMARDRLEGRP